MRTTLPTFYRIGCYALCGVFLAVGTATAIPASSGPTAVKTVDITITGTVTGADEGEGLPGVNVLVKGTSIGTITDVEGNYRLSAPDDATTLVFSFVGYTAKEVPINGQTTINVTLESDIKALEEVVVVGFGTQKKADLTGSVGSISAAEIAEKPITSPDQALAGRISGVQISNRSGDPGAPINVRIRGVGTAGVNQPLWVIDGVPIVQTSNITVNTGSSTETNPLAGINPNDIKSIDVLKDAASAAIYGARAANGVIIVTTKRGEAGKTSVTYDGYIGTQYTPKRIDVLNVDQFIDLQTEIGRDVTEFRGQPFIDWQDATFKTGPMRSHNVTASGGSEAMNFSVSAGYLNQEGIELAQSFERYSFKANSDLRVGKRKQFTFGESLIVSFVDRLVQSENSGLRPATRRETLPTIRYITLTDPSATIPKTLRPTEELPATITYTEAT